MRMFWIAILLESMALAAAAPTTRPSPAALDKQITELIVQLDSPDSAVRERATLKLINLGPRVLKPLRDALALEVSPEFANRAREIIHEITSQWKYVNEFGGNVVGGFQATLEARTNTFAAGRPIPLNLIFRCVGVNGHRLAETRSIDIELEGGPVFSAPQSEGKLLIKKIADAKLPDRATPLICNSGEPHSIDFNVGGSVNTALWIDHELQLSPGEYELKFIYYAHSKAILEEALEDLESNPLRLKITR